MSRGLSGARHLARRSRVGRRALLAAVTLGLVAASVHDVPLVAGAQTAPGAPDLTLRLVTDGAAGGPFGVVLIPEAPAGPTL
ncbi:MAG TPA: hypothetical protein VH479_13405, partial [Acidimicrobiales bacterium]